jgi:phosphate acetyltransferase
MLWFKKTFIEQVTIKAIAANNKSKKTIVFPEVDKTIIRACSIILKKGIATPIIIGNKDDIRAILNSEGIKNITEQNIIDPLDETRKAELELFTKEFREMRIHDGKAITLEESGKLMRQSHFYAGMLVHKGTVDGMISGINSSTKPYLPAFQIIKTKENVKRASGLMIMEKGQKVYFFADIALTIDPTSEELASIALTSAETVINFGIKPKIAMLSFSTRGSAKHELVDTVQNATKIIKQKNPELSVDGEIQVDAAIVPDVYKKKCPDSMLEGQANVLIFPDLNAGNIGYKLVQRMAGYNAIGPIMQGLNKPVNDLSRGASVKDVVELTAITVVQSLQ